MLNNLPLLSALYHDLISTVSGPSHIVANGWDATRDVLLTKKNHLGITTISQYDYTVNPLGQRTGVSQTGTAFAASRAIDWAYDNLGQVVKADSDNNTDDRAYQYDGIGNRLKSADSLTLPVDNNYSPNALNQYAATPYGSAGVPPAYDLDGNMTSGPLPAASSTNSALAWDAENRLIETTVGTSGPLVRYSYDSQSRRIAKTVGTTTTVYVYDGWNPICEYSIINNQSTITRSFTWGLDLSGTMQGAGGVGGLLSVTVGTSGSLVRYYPTYDGNGNVSEYLDNASAVTAHFEYDPFGNTVVNTDSGNLFSHRFSTKQLDLETGLYYYGYRYYDPNTGRWPSRDPIEEAGGINLYGFVRNNGIGKVDFLGMWFTDGRDVDKLNLRQVAGTIYIRLGRYESQVQDEKLKNNDEAIAAAQNHENRHIEAAKGSANANAIPYKQVFCLEKDGKATLHYYSSKSGVPLRMNFGDGDNHLWHYKASIDYTTHDLENQEEIKELKAEIVELQKVKNSPFITNRIIKTLKPKQENHETGKLSRQKGDVQEWTAFKLVHSNEILKAKNNGAKFSWYKEETVYKELIDITKNENHSN